ncbi:MAG: hypothetical protein KJO82_08710 [Gammaproteobacteria bacterium]|nr:hypothetical protein [Gammaproteobacteria bacterium]
MDTAWIQVFVLTLAECVAPAGKTICQEQQLEMVFLNENDCNVALEQLVSLKSDADDVIVNAERSTCTPTARRKEIFRSVNDINHAYANVDGWRAPETSQSPTDFTQASHKERLANLQNCDETNGVAPCKIGEIVIEAAGAGEPVEVWRRED